MFGHRSFLVLGGGKAADIMSLIRGGYEILDCGFSLNQGIDERGKATTRVYGGSFDVTLSQLPPLPIVEWALNSRKYLDGMIVVLDEGNAPVSKFLFERAACTCFDINYMQQGSGYVATKLLIQAEKIVLGDGIDFNNEWTETE